MASDYTPTNVTSGFQMEVTINQNLNDIKTAMDKTLNRSFNSDNAMKLDLDMNSQQILNLPAPAGATNPVRLGDIDGTFVPTNELSSYANITLALAGSNSIGEFLRTAEYTAGKGKGGALYKVVAAATGTNDGGLFLNRTSDSNQLQQIVTDRVDIYTYGVAGDGVVNDTAKIQAAVTAIEGTSLSLFLPEGNYVVRNDTGISVTKAIKITGAGRSRSIIQFDNFFTEVSVKPCFFTDVTASAVVKPYLTFMDFAIIGQWGEDVDFSENGGLVSLFNFDQLLVTRMHFKGSRAGGLVTGTHNDVLVTDSLFENCYRDSCRMGTTNRTIIANNTFINIQDDCIAIQNADGNTQFKDNSIIITGNNIYDSQGIATIGGKTVIIANNNIIRPMHRAILVGQSATFDVGHTSALAINIVNNNIIDGFDGKVFSVDSGSGFRAIDITSEQLIAKDTVESGDPVITPYPFLYLNNTDDASTVNAGLYNLKVSGNTITRTLDATANYSDYGFGSRLSRSGVVDPVITLPDMMDVGIFVSGGGNGLQIHNNSIDGCIKNIEADLFTAANGVAHRNYKITNNNLKNWRDSGIHFNGEGFLEIKDNIFDGDPYHEAPIRNADGGWTASTTDHRGILFESGTTTLFGLIANNTFKNLGVVFFQGGTGLTAVEMQKNLLICDPSVTGHSTANKGIGFISNLGILDANLVIEDSDPSSSTFKEIQSIGETASTALPTTGKYIVGQFVRDTSNSSIFGWKRKTNGSNHVLNTDWIPV